MLDLNSLINQEVKIDEKEGEITRILGCQWCEITYFNAIDGKTLIHANDIEKFLVKKVIEMSKQNKYPDYILRRLRLREDLDDNDTSMDEQFNNYSPDKVFSEVCEWEGLIGWSGRLKGWIEVIYNVNLDDIK